MSGKTPSYLKNKLPRLRRPLYRQSNNNTFHELRCNYFRYMSSFFPDAITSWNNVIPHFNDISCFSVLKNHILSLIRPKKKCIFGIHDPFGLRYLFQLRVDLSSLRYHKKCHNFLGTPSDKCLCNQGIEDTNHFLLLCPFLLLEEQSFVVNVIANLQKHGLTHLGNQSHPHLYGHPTINFADNRKILLSTIEHIKGTRRLST